MKQRQARMLAGASYVLLCVATAEVGCNTAGDEGPGSFNPVTGATVGGGGDSKSLNICACLQVALDEESSSEPCLSCHADTVKDGEACDSAQQACTQSEACQDVVQCVDGCDTSGDSDLDCVRACILPMDGSMGKQIYADWLTCMCERCSTSCNAYGDVACEPAAGGMGGSGGSGGSGGIGGSGGVGGIGGIGGS